MCLCFSLTSTDWVHQASKHDAFLISDLQTIAVHSIVYVCVSTTFTMLTCINTILLSVMLRSKRGGIFARKLTDLDHMTPERGSALKWGHTAGETSSLTEHGRKHRMLCVCVCVMSFPTGKTEWAGKYRIVSKNTADSQMEKNNQIALNNVCL